MWKLEGWRMLWNKIDLSTFKDLTGFIQWLMNCAASNLADRKELYPFYGQRLYKQWEVTRKLYKAKKQVGCCKVTFHIGDGRGLSGRLLNKGDPWLAGLRLHFWENKTGMKSGDVGLIINEYFVYFLVFNMEYMYLGKKKWPQFNPYSCPRKH